MKIPGITNAFKAGGAIPARRILKHGTANGEAVLAAAAGDSLIGVSTNVASVAGATVDVVRTGLAEVEFGGAVTRGAAVTSDANGRAVAAAPAAGSNVRILGFAEETCANGDIGTVLLSIGVMQG